MTPNIICMTPSTTDSFILNELVNVSLLVETCQIWTKHTSRTKNHGANVWHFSTSAKSSLTLRVSGKNWPYQGCGHTNNEKLSRSGVGVRVRLDENMPVIVLVDRDLHIFFFKTSPRQLEKLVATVTTHRVQAEWVWVVFVKVSVQIKLDVLLCCQDLLTAVKQKFEQQEYSKPRDSKNAKFRSTRLGCS